MLYTIADFNLKNFAARIDWKLLLFLLLFLDVKLAVKIVAIIIIYLLRFDFKFGFSFKNSRLPLFYLLIMPIPFINLVINKGYVDFNYLLVFFSGLGFWALCLLAVHQVKLAVDDHDTEVIHNTILLFFIVNTLFSFCNIAGIMLETGSLNPYRYQGEYQKYFIGTGDYIKGITFDTSTTNAALNAMGVVYFLIRKNMPMLLVCMVVLLLTGSNFLNMALLFVLALLFVFRSSKNQKSLMVICLVFLVVFMVKISPQNDRYVAETFKDAVRPPVPHKAAAAVTCSNIPGLEERRRQIATHYLDSVKKANYKKIVHDPYRQELSILPKTNQGRILLDTVNINTRPYQTPTDTTADQRVLLRFIDQHKTSLPLSAQKVFIPGLPGKIVAFLQTFRFFKQHPGKLITGDGMGNFSSKLAFRATAFGFSGGFPAGHLYISPDFLVNHLDVYLNFFSKQKGLHSLTNSPNSVYDQLLAEYGLFGLLAFAIAYVGFFARHIKAITYGLPLLVLLMLIFFTDYWFEQLSVIVFFELLLLLNIKETAVNPKPDYAS